MIAVSTLESRPSVAGTSSRRRTETACRLDVLFPAPVNGISTDAAVPSGLVVRVNGAWAIPRATASRSRRSIARRTAGCSLDGPMATSTAGAAVLGNSFLIVSSVANTGLDWDESVSPLGLLT